MTFGKLVRSLLLNLILAPCAAPAQGAPRLQIQEVDLVGYEGAALRVQVELSCGAELYGLVVRAAANNRLEIAAAVLEDSVICTSLPEPKEILADFISTAGYKSVAAMPVDAQNKRLTVARVSDVKILPAAIRGNAEEIEAIYQTRCGIPVGTLIRKASATRIEVGFAERLGNHGFSEECKPTQVRKRVAALSPLGRYDVAPLPDRPASLARSFYLKYAPIKAGSLTYGVARGVTVTYRRGCNEAPVGLVVNDRGAGPDGRRRVEVAMVVARYFNFPCTSAKKALWDSFGDDDLRLSGNGLAVTIRGAAPKGERLPSLSMKTPTSLRMAKEPGLTVSYVLPCADPAGLIYTRDADDRLAVGVLMASTGAASCNAKGMEVSLYQPFLAERVRTTGVMPLRLKGQPAR